MKEFDNNVIFRNHKLIYVAIPKAANTAVKKSLIPLLGVPDPMKDYHSREGPFEYCRKQDVASHTDFFKVTLVRNTWSRVYSCWHDKVYAPASPMKFQNQHFYQGMPFLDFVKAISAIPDELSNVHYRSQTALFMDGERMLVNLILPMEKIGRFHQLIEAYTRIPLAPLIASNKKNIRPYTEFYNQEAIDLIYQRYRKEIDLLGFEYGAASGSPSELSAKSTELNSASKSVFVDKRGRRRILLLRPLRRVKDLIGQVIKR
jgi:hypothetical protein